jgi:transposase InsO family protein
VSRDASTSSGKSTLKHGLISLAGRIISRLRKLLLSIYTNHTLGEFLREAERWSNFYNQRRPHEGLHQQSPDQFAKDHGLPTSPY